LGFSPLFWVRSWALALLNLDFFGLKPNYKPFWGSETGFLTQIFGFNAKIVAETRFLGHHLGFYIQIFRGGGHGVIKIVRETERFRMPCPYK